MTGRTPTWLTRAAMAALLLAGLGCLPSQPDSDPGSFDEQRVVLGELCDLCGGPDIDGELVPGEVTRGEDGHAIIDDGEGSTDRIIDDGEGSTDGIIDDGEGSTDGIIDDGEVVAGAIGQLGQLEDSRLAGPDGAEASVELVLLQPAMC